MPLLQRFPMPEIFAPAALQEARMGERVPTHDKQFARICQWLKANRMVLRSYNTHKSAKRAVVIVLEPKR